MPTKVMTTKGGVDKSCFRNHEGEKNPVVKGDTDPISRVTKRQRIDLDTADISMVFDTYQ